MKLIEIDRTPQLEGWVFGVVLASGQLAQIDLVRAAEGESIRVALVVADAFDGLAKNFAVSSIASGSTCLLVRVWEESSKEFLDSLSVGTDSLGVKIFTVVGGKSDTDCGPSLVVDRAVVGEGVAGNGVAAILHCRVSKEGSVFPSKSTFCCPWKRRDMS